jgi:hypothetical protein
VQALIDAGQVKVVGKNGRAQLEGPLPGAAAAQANGKNPMKPEVAPARESVGPTKPASTKVPEDRFGF